MTTTINASALGIIQSGDTSGNLQLMTANVAAITIDYNQNIVCNGTGGIVVPVGTTAQRPATAGNGTVRYNTSSSTLEGFLLGAWTNIKAGTYTIEYLLVAGGGGGGNYNSGGGGGAGGMISASTTVTPGTAMAIVVGGGGAGGIGSTPAPVNV